MNANGLWPLNDKTLTNTTSRLIPISAVIEVGLWGSRAKLKVYHNVYHLRLE